MYVMINTALLRNVLGKMAGSAFCSDFDVDNSANVTVIEQIMLV